MGLAVTDAQVAAFRPRVEELAAPFQRQAEMDDLVQEGLISVWLALQKGVHPTDQVIRGAMKNWCRTLRRQTYGRSERLAEDVEAR